MEAMETAEAPQGAVITVEQYDRGRALAGAFGHRWANDRDAPSVSAYADSVRYGGTGVSVAEIARRAAEDAHEGTIGGIFAPETVTARVLGYGAVGDPNAPVVAHATGTRRLRWHILPDGETRLFVTRPVADGEEVVLTASVAAGWLSAPAEVAVGTSAEVRPHARHFQALQEALAPLVGAERAWELVLPHAAALGVRLAAQWYGGGILWILLDPEQEVGGAVVFPVGVTSLAAAFGMLRPVVAA